jgi:hypothetical protein
MWLKIKRHIYELRMESGLFAKDRMRHMFNNIINKSFFILLSPQFDKYQITLIILVKIISSMFDLNLFIFTFEYFPDIC